MCLVNCMFFLDRNGGHVEMVPDFESSFWNSESELESYLFDHSACDRYPMSTNHIQIPHLWVPSIHTTENPADDALACTCVMPSDAQPLKTLVRAVNDEKPESNERVHEVWDVRDALGEA
jgi:hypothetical protein